MNPLERASTLFLAPAGEPRRPSPRVLTVPAPFAPSAIVLGARADAMPVARLLATELRLRAGGGCVLVGEWHGGEPEGPASGQAHPATRRLAARLAGRGLEGSARGRTLHLALPGDPVAAAAAWQRAVAAAGAPAICALAGPRTPAFDPLLDEQDLLVLAPAADAVEALTELALSGLAGVRTPVVVSRPVARRGAGVVAASSFATSRALGQAVTEAVKALA